MQAIGETVTHIYRSSTEIAAAITEQQSATDEIARNIQFVSSSTEKIGESMGSVRESADKNNIASAQVHTASSTMSGQTEKLAVEVGDFLTAVKGAGTRHQFERLNTDAAARVTVGGQSLSTRAKQISIGGAWLDVRIDQPPGSTLEVTIEGIPRAIRARVAGTTDKGTRLQFPMDSAHLSFMSGVISQLAAKAACAPPPPPGRRTCSAGGLAIPPIRRDRCCHAQSGAAHRLDRASRVWYGGRHRQEGPQR